MRQLIFYFYFIFFSTNVFAQFNPAGTLKHNTEPRPFDKLYFINPSDFSNIESITFLNKNKRNNFKQDTLNIKYYNQNGDLLKRIGFEKNKRKNPSTYIYHGTKLYQDFWIEKNKKNLNTYYYDSFGNETKSIYEQIILDKEPKDTHLIFVQKFKYQDSKLMEFSSNKVGDKIETYEYDDKGNLIKVEGSFKPLEFTYNEKNQLIETKEYSSKIHPDWLSAIRTYSYDAQGRLMKDTTLPLKNFELGEPYVSVYRYNEKDEMISMSTTFQDLYCNVSILYQEGNVSEFQITTNTKNLAYFKYYFYAPYGTPLPYNIIEKNEYDKHGNNIRKTRHIEGELTLDNRFEIKYRGDKK